MNDADAAIGDISSRSVFASEQFEHPATINENDVISFSHFGHSRSD